MQFFQLAIRTRRQLLSRVVGEHKYQTVFAWRCLSVCMVAGLYCRECYQDMQNLCAVCNRLVTYDDIDITPEESV